MRSEPKGDAQQAQSASEPKGNAKRAQKPQALKQPIKSADVRKASTTTRTTVR